MATKTKVVPITAGKPTGTAVVVKKTGSNVVSIMDALRAQAAAVTDKTAPASGNAIRVTQDKQFILPDGTKTPGPLELVIVDFASKNTFYERAFDPKAITPPACFSLGSNPLKMVPSNNAPLKQAEDCSACPMNQFGSDGDGKACKNSRVLAVLPPKAYDKDGNLITEVEDMQMWTLATSPTANKGFDGFVTSVARIFQLPPVGVFATVGFDPSVTYAKLVFSNPQANPDVGEYFARQAEARAMLAVEPDVSQYKSAAPAKKAVGRR